MNSPRPSPLCAHPRYPSYAPIVSNGEPVVVLLNCNGTSFIKLPSYDPDGDLLNTTLGTLPEHGHVFDMHGKQLFPGDLVSDKEVLYKTSAQSQGLSSRDNFTYIVTDGGDPVTASVIVEPYSLPEPTDRVIEMDEDGMAYEVLGMMGYDNKRLNVVITAIPERGVSLGTTIEMTLHMPSPQSHQQLQLRTYCLTQPSLQSHPCFEHIAVVSLSWSLDS